MRVQIQKRGQITTPKKVREKLNLAEGAVLELEVEGHRLMLVPGVPARVIAKFVPAQQSRQLGSLVFAGGNALSDSEKLFD